MGQSTKQVLKQVATSVGVTNYLHYREYLGGVYQRLKSASDSYSYLKFAQDLGFSLTNVMRLIIAGKRPLTSKAASKVAQALDLHGIDKRYWEKLVLYNNERSPSEREALFSSLMTYKAQLLPSPLDQTQLRYFTEWYYPVIREMVGLGDFQLDAAWVQQRLSFPLRLEQIKKGLELLGELGLIKFDQKQQRVIRSDEQIATPSEVESMAVVNYHQRMIEAGRESITRVDEDQRSINALTVCLPESAVPIIKGKIQELLHQIMEMEKQAAAAEQVYQVNVQLFPFTKLKR